MAFRGDADGGRGGHRMLQSEHDSSVTVASRGFGPRRHPPAITPADDGRRSRIRPDAGTRPEDR